MNEEALALKGGISELEQICNERGWLLQLQREPEPDNVWIVSASYPGLDARVFGRAKELTSAVVQALMVLEEQQ